jgi:hypothetical protein
MSTDFEMRILMPLALGLVSLAFVAIGLYALMRRRPFTVRSRWMLLAAVIGFSPQIITLFSSFVSDPKYRTGWTDATSVLLVAMTVVILAFLAMQMRGYWVFGATQESFREALLSALAGLNLKVEETMSSVKLPSIPAELQTPIQGWLGTGQVRLRSGGRPRLLEDIRARMQAYFDSGNAQTNMTTAIVYLILGILMIGIVTTLSLSWPTHPNAVSALAIHLFNAT